MCTFKRQPCPVLIGGGPGGDILRLLIDRFLQGSSLMNVPESIPGLAVVCAGAIEGDVSMKPKFELFEEDRRPWLGTVNNAAKL
jgi:hypothetical protein